MSLQNRRDEYYAARRAYDNQKAALKMAKQFMETAKHAFIDALLDSSVKSVTSSDGTVAYLRRSFSFAANKANYDQIREWLIEEFGDDKPFIKEQIDKAALGEKLRKMVDYDADGSDEDEPKVDIKDLPEFLRVSTRPDVSVRGWKATLETEDDDDEQF